MKRQLLITLIALSLTMPLVSDLFNLSDLETVVSASAPAVNAVKPSLNTQALTAAEVEARQYKPLGQPLTLYAHEAYRLNYPSGWQAVEVSPQLVKLQAPTSEIQILVQTLTTNEDLTTVVNRHVARTPDAVRQSLEINGWPAERVITPSANHEPTVRFFINLNQTLYLISGTADRMTLETVAKSMDK